MLLFLLKPVSRVVRGQAIVDVPEMQRILDKRQEAIENRELPRLQIAGVELPNDLENLGFFFVGSPGSGKTQGIKRMLQTLRDRNDFRVMVLLPENADKAFFAQSARSLLSDLYERCECNESLETRLEKCSKIDDYFSKIIDFANLYQRFAMAQHNPIFIMKRR